jgi:protein-disulfide isomerase
LRNSFPQVAESNERIYEEFRNKLWDEQKEKWESSAAAQKLRAAELAAAELERARVLELKTLVHFPSEMFCTWLTVL